MRTSIRGHEPDGDVTCAPTRCHSAHVAQEEKCHEATLGRFFQNVMICYLIFVISDAPPPAVRLQVDGNVEACRLDVIVNVRKAKR